MSNRKGLWHNIRKNRGSGKKPTAEMLKQEKKIKANTGKKMVMDIAQIPRSEGIDLDKWMYMFDNLGIAFINIQSSHTKS